MIQTTLHGRFATSSGKTTTIRVVRPARTPLATSQEIRDRGSAFVGHVYRATTATEAKATVQYHHETHATSRAASHTHHAPAFAGGSDTQRGETQEKDEDTYYTMAAWRCMTVKPGRTGLGGPEEFELEVGCDDGGERWAGKRILGVMQREGVIDAVVVVSRWFGGTLIGPVRFTHIETCASEVCRRFKKLEEMEECVQTLNTLDDLLAVLRAELATVLEKAKVGEANATSNDPQPKSKAPDYRTMQEALDLTKAKKLIHARECAIQNTKALIDKYKIST